MKNRSLRFKLVLLGVGMQVVLVAVLFSLYYRNEKANIEKAYIERARGICLQAESVREGMEDKWRQELFTSDMLKAWMAEGAAGQDKIFASVPVVSAWEAATKKAQEGGYEFRTPKFHPRNPSNQPDAIEAQAIDAMEKQNLSEWHVIDHEKNAVRYFRPVKITESCILSHGEPAS